MANTAITAALGFAFWIMAARLYSPSVVGRDAALVAGLIELSSICQLNLSNAVVDFVARVRGSVGHALVGAYAVGALAAIVVGTAFIVLAPRVSEDLREVTRPTSIAVVYVVSLVIWG